MSQTAQSNLDSFRDSLAVGVFVDGDARDADVRAKPRPPQGAGDDLSEVAELGGGHGADILNALRSRSDWSVRPKL